MKLQFSLNLKIIKIKLVVNLWLDRENEPQRRIKVRTLVISKDLKVLRKNLTLGPRNLKVDYPHEEGDPRPKGN